MDIIKPENHNFTYIGDASQNIADLPARVGQDEHGCRTITSAWKPTEEELLKLLNGGIVELSVWGDAQPPVMLTVASATGDLFKQEPMSGVIGYAQKWESIDGAWPDTYTFDMSLESAKYRWDYAGLGWRKVGEPFPVMQALGFKPNEEMTAEDEACPILANAPAEYSYWEKRVWRRGVQDAHTQIIRVECPDEGCPHYGTPHGHRS